MKTLVSQNMKRFNHLNGELNSVYHSASVKFGLSDSASMILYTVYEFGGNCLLTDICYLTGLAKQTVNSAIHKLEKDGVVRLEYVNPKSKKVLLTEQGIDFADKTASKIIQAENEVFESWGDEDVQQYLALTERYLVALKEKVKVL